MFPPPARAPRTHLARRSVSIVTALAVLGTAAACEPTTVTDSSRRLYCQIFADPPQRDNDENPSKIVGSVRYSCDPPGVDQLSLTLRLQKQGSNGRWVDVRKTSFTVRKRQSVRPDGKRYQTRELTIACGAGVFRTLVTGTSKARGFTSQYEKIGGRNFDPCRPSLFAS